jgi:acetoacetyl-CoA synthetase
LCGVAKSDTAIMTLQGETLWEPSADAAERSNVGRFTTWLEHERGLNLRGYEDLWTWSVQDLEGFWSAIWEHFDLTSHTAADGVIGRREMPGAEWFPGATLNWAEHILARAPEGVAVVARSQTRGDRELTRADLEAQVGAARLGLLRIGVRRGDRIAAYLPNIPEALVLLLAAASLGALFTSCPPEFGEKAVLDRFRQVDPTVLVAVDGYMHRGRAVDRSAVVTRIRRGLPSLRRTILVPYLTANPGATEDMLWDDLLVEPGPLTFDAVPFGHPLYVLYTSGTTGLPKPIVHGHGGILLEHTKLHHLHHDLGPNDRFFWHSTTGWVMWNYLVSGLLTGASIVLFDGDPGYPNLSSLWQLAEETGVTAFGVGAPLLLACRKAGLRPGREHDLAGVRQVGSTGAPLPAEGARWVYESVHSDLLLVSASGGTDVATAFVASVPTLPVIAGEITCRCLGVKVEAFDQQGFSVIEEQGELVVTEPMPSMPVGLWGDADGSRYRGAYFEQFPGVWAHGDWITITERGTCIITGRSDATLNRGGVRLGTSDFYSVVEQLEDVADSLVVHLEDPEGGAGELLLFIELSEESTFGPDLCNQINERLRTTLSPRHVPDTILEVPTIPRTLSGKKTEIPVKRILQGTPVSEAVNRDTTQDPDAFEPFSRLARSRA